MEVDGRCCAHRMVRDQFDKLKKRERDQADTIRQLTKELQLRNKQCEEFDRLYQEQRSIAAMERRDLETLRKEYDDFRYKLMCTECQGYMDLPRNDGDTIEVPDCHACQPKKEGLRG